MTRPHESGSVDIVGKTYQYRTPKSAIVMSAVLRAKGKPELEQAQIILGAKIDSLRQALGSEGWADIEDRLSQAPEDDPIDIEDLTEAFETIMAEKSAGRPTTSLAESSPQLPTTETSEAKPKQPESIFGT